MITVYQITSSYFTAGLVLIRGIVTEAAPIVRYMTGWSEKKVRHYVAHKRWKIADETPKRKVAVKK